MTSRELFNYERLHPKAREHFRNLSTRLRLLHERGNIETLFLPFEGFRGPERQNYLFHVEKTTKAKAWQSAHNYGLAVDYVAFENGKWSWDQRHDWAGLKAAAVNSGMLVPIAWDKPHVEHPIWFQVKSALV